MAKPTSELLKNLRGFMQQYGQLSAYIVPSDDPHMSEYVSSNYHRRAFVSGFTGSAGTAVITTDKALMWTDGRYFLQAENQMDKNWTLMKAFMPGTPSEEEWLSANLTPPSRVGIDPKTCSVKKFKALYKKLDSVGLELVAVKDNLIDKIWDDAPKAPTDPVYLHPIEFAGKSTFEKLEEVRKSLSEKQCDSFIVSALDDVAWLYNLRGSDVTYNPVFYSFAIITKDSSVLYLDDNKISKDIEEYLDGVNTTVKPYEAVYRDVKNLKGRVLLSLSTNAAISEAIDVKNRVVLMSPIQQLKAVKNEVELKGMRDCHVRDGGALTEYFHWLTSEVHKEGVVIDEVDGSDKAEYFRSKEDKFVDLSFDTISSSGPNGAIIHYKPEKGTCLVIDKNDIYLCDSGAQYKDGTTDVTRTLHLGTPNKKQIDRFTRVLKGHIDLAMAIFPPSTKGTCIDCLARIPLWNVGLNYQHGTGHGVGSFLNVHEGPCRISGGNRMSKYEMGLEKGMILSNEPGFYEKGEFGMRIESLVEVIEANVCPEGEKYLGFRTITMAPIEKKLIDVSMLTDAELDWLNTYHSEVYAKLKSLYESQGKGKELLQYLYDATSPLVKAK